jgi:hypothetical protein
VVEMYWARIPWRGGGGGARACVRACTRRLTCPLLPKANSRKLFSRDGAGQCDFVTRPPRRLHLVPPYPCAIAPGGASHHPLGFRLILDLYM